MHTNAILRLATHPSHRFAKLPPTGHSTLPHLCTRLPVSKISTANMSIDHLEIRDSSNSKHLLMDYSPIPGGAIHRELSVSEGHPGLIYLINPFARRSLPDTAQAAHLLRRNL